MKNSNYHPMIQAMKTPRKLKKRKKNHLFLKKPKSSHTNPLMLKTQSYMTRPIETKRMGAVRETSFRMRKLTLNSPNNRKNQICGTTC